MTTGDKPEEEDVSGGLAFAMIEQAMTFVSGPTGIKAQFVAQGWSELAAEQLVVAMFMKAPDGS